MTYVILSTLPATDPRRSMLTLGALKAECRNVESTVWRKVYAPPWSIATSTFNQVCEQWGQFNDFRVPA